MILAVLAAVGAAACAGQRTNAPAPFVDSRDGQAYPVVRIGDQTWLARDLSFPAGDSYCYGDRPGGCPPYGRLYPWAVAVRACPEGWRLPSEAE